MRAAHVEHALGADRLRQEPLDVADPLHPSGRGLSKLMHETRHDCDPRREQSIRAMIAVSQKVPTTQASDLQIGRS